MFKVLVFCLLYLFSNLILVPGCISYVIVLIGTLASSLGTNDPKRWVGVI